MDEERNLNQPLKMQGADPNKVMCKDCVFRDRTMLKLDDRIIPTGMIKSWCKVYTKENSNGKPIGVLLRNEDCKYYMKEEKDTE